jgi:hypothetical protein
MARNVATLVWWGVIAALSSPDEGHLSLENMEVCVMARQMARQMELPRHERVGDVIARHAKCR